MRASYAGLLHWCLDHRTPVLAGFAVFVAGSLCLAPLVGRDFFPTVDAGQFRLHMRARTATRIEETANICDQVEQSIRKQIPANELTSILDNIGLPNSGINLAFSDSITNGNGDGEILISLKPDHHPTLEYTRKIRSLLGQGRS